MLNSSVARMLVYRGIIRNTSTFEAKVPTANIAVFDKSFLYLPISFLFRVLYVYFTTNNERVKALFKTF